MRLIYFAHSYRKPDNAVNEFFQELMLDEGLTPSLDPMSDRLNAAKPERHLRSTDAMVTVLTWRDPEPSPYILWEIGLGLRARKPQLVLVEDTLPDDLVPPGLLQRRFSRRRLLREARDHRHAFKVLAGYVGSDPPPTYQLASTRRSCILIGASLLGEEPLAALTARLQALRYSTTHVPATHLLPDGSDLEGAVQRASLCIALVEGLTPAEFYLLGVARAALTPTILLTHDPQHPYHPSRPLDYQPRYVRQGDAEALVSTVSTQIDIFEEDYLELVEEQQVKRYHAFQERLLRAQRDGSSQEARRQVFNFMSEARVDMSRDKIEVSGVVGPVNIKSRLEHVVQSVQQAPALSDANRETLQQLIQDLQAGLESVQGARAEDADRVTKMAELVAAEATKAKPDKGFLSFSVDGLKQAAQAVADIAPAVLATATKVAAFVAALSAP